MESTERSVKIPKQDLGALQENRWIVLVLFMKDLEPAVYLIPSKVFEKPDNYIFFENAQGERFAHLSNWEIRVFTKGIKDLSKYAFGSMAKQMK